MIRVVIAEPDDKTRANILNLLKDDATMEIVADCCDGTDTCERLKILEPNILILDAEMPKMCGFEILESATRPGGPYVIMTSAHDKYAARAFEFGVTDYLIKPLNKYRFLEAITKVKRYIERDRRADGGSAVVNHHADPANGYIRPTAERIPIKNGRRVRLLNASAIRYVLADRDFANLHMVTGEVIHSSERISHLEIKLPIERFQRIQRSVIVNLEHVQEIRSKKGKYEFVMGSGEGFMSGYLYKRELSTLVATWSKRRHAA